MSRRDLPQAGQAQAGMPLTDKWIIGFVNYSSIWGCIKTKKLDKFFSFKSC
jgi:hypothetical protein